MRERLDLTDKEIRKIENLTAPMAFDRLLGLVHEVCLDNPLPASEITPNTETTVVAQLGFRGLRAAIETAEGLGKYPDNLDSFFVRPDEPMVTPERFSDSLDVTALTKTESLGQGFLNESFKHLGEDALGQIEKFKVASNSDDQARVILWLEQRLRDIAVGTVAHELGGDTNNTFYHPLRLSPKMMGTYPEHTTKPTCLGVSILASSFLEQTGSPILHAGVMKTRIEEQRAEAYSFFVKVPNIIRKKYGLSLPAELEYSLQKAAYTMFRAGLEDRGYHAAVYCRLKDDLWYQFDPNFESSGIIMSDEVTQQLDTAHHLLTDFKDTAPGLEMSVDFTSPALARLATYFLYNGSPLLLPELEKVASFLQDKSPESVIERAKDLFVKPFFESVESTLPGAEGCSLVDAELYDEIFYKTFRKYVLWGEPLDDVMAKCRQDTEYCGRRAEDIRLLPLTMLTALVGDDVNRADSPLHQAIEVGLPAPRIGAAVINDFANFYGQNLPPSYRISQWASHVPLTEVDNSESTTPAQKKLIVDNASWQLGILRYSKSNAKIVSTLIRERERQEKDVGNQTGGS